MDQFIAFLSGLAPWVPSVLMALGSLVVIATAIDSIFKLNFMAKVLAIPFLGAFISHVVKFSPLNYDPSKVVSNKIELPKA